MTSWKMCIAKCILPKMVKLKTEEEIDIMVQGGKKLRIVVAKLIPSVKPGVSTEEIDKKAEELIKKQGAEPSFQKVRGYFWSTCLSINEQVVHTPPSKRIIKEGDVFTLDIGVYFRGFHTDFATTFIVGKKKDKETEKFLDVGRQTLKKALEKVKMGNFLGEVSETIESEITKHGLFVLKELTGHGIGRELHEDPTIPGFLPRPKEKTVKVRPGLVVAIEVIYSKGTDAIVYEKDSDWSLVTDDQSLSACFEHTIAIRGRNSIILT